MAESTKVRHGGFRPEDIQVAYSGRQYRRQSFPVEPRERTRWQALQHVLFRDLWEPAPRDERTLRWASSAISLIANALFAFMLLYLMYLQYIAMQPQEEDVQNITLVEFIGRGNKVEGGGNAQPAQQTSTAQSAAAASASATTASASVPSQAENVTSATADESQEIVQVSPRVTLSKETQPEPDTFTLPDARLPTPTVSQTPTLQAPQRDVPLRDVGTPVANPNVSLQAPPSSANSVTISIPQRGVAERTIATPTPLVNGASSTVVSATPPRGAAQATTSSTGVAGTSTAARPSGTGTANSTGPRATPAPGGWYQSRGADDWGESTRNRPGSNSGSRTASDGMLKGNDLFDENGKPKLPYRGSASRNDPPGLRNGEIRDLDRAGTWRKRRPTDIGGGGSMVWLPNEDVLEELVRRGIKDFSIKIPGTSAVLKCRVSLLQLGGGCMPDDPNMQDQEAIARPPPKVPYKPELNQHNGGRQIDTPPEDFGPGAILPGQEIKKVQGTTPLPPPQNNKPTFKFGDDQ